MSDESQEDPKLIIDEDWKSQVQREKEELQQPTEETDSEPNSTESSGTDSAEATEQPLPPASLEILVTSLATQAAAAMGQMPPEDGEELPVNLNFARHFIDLIGVIEEKTKGNLTEDESKFVQEMLHQLRMMYVAVSQQQP